MAHWTFCWDEGCVDMVAPEQMPDVPRIEVTEGQEVTFHLGFDPSEVSLFLPDRDEHLRLPADRQVSWAVTDLGFVVLTAWRDAGGDASYLVRLEAPDV